jgi:hypothetical protein
MKKSKLSRIMTLGIVSGTLIAAKQGLIAEDGSGLSKDFNELLNAENGNMGYHLMTEDELMLQLNEEGARIYHSLSPEGKQLALKVASQRCDHTNECKHLNACRTDQNACLGKGQCKGQGKCAFSDKNLAVKVVAKKMAEKRNQAQGNTPAVPH